MFYLHVGTVPISLRVSEFQIRLLNFECKIRLSSLKGFISVQPGFLNPSWIVFDVENWVISSEMIHCASPDVLFTRQ